MQKIVQTKWAKKPSSFAIKLLFSQILCKGSTKSAHKKIIIQNFDFQHTPTSPINPIIPINPIFSPSKKVPSAFRAGDFYQDSFSRNYFTKIFFTSPLLVRTMLIPFWSELTRVPETVKICAAFVMFSAVAVEMPEASALGSCALLVPK